MSTASQKNLIMKYR
jgi:hypothetical protein